MAKTALEVILVEFAAALKPLGQKLTAGNFSRFMAELGWQWKQEAPNFDAIVNRINSLETAIVNIDISLPYERQINEYGDLIRANTELVSSISDILSSFPSPLPSALLETSFADNIGKQIIDYSICTHIEQHHPLLFQCLLFPRIIEIKDVRPTVDLPTYRKYAVRWENIQKTIGDFKKRVADVYWDKSKDELKDNLLIDAFEGIFLACEIPTARYCIPPEVVEKLFSSSSQDDDSSTWETEKLLRIPLYEIADSEAGFLEAGFSILAVPTKEDDQKLKGIAILPYLEGKPDFDFALTENLRLLVTGDIKTGLAIIVLPSGVKIEPDIYGATGFDGSFEVKLSHQASEGKIIVFGEPDQSRFEYQELSAALKLTGVDPNADLIFELGLVGASLIIRGADGDGLVQRILPADPITFDLDLLLGVSRSQGLYFQLGAGLEYKIVVNRSLDPIFINTIDLKFDAKDGNLALITAISGGVKIGPVEASVEEIGLKTFLETGKPGVLGNADISMGFKPPTGIGLVIDAETVKGGGALTFDNGNYYGVVTLEIQDRISVDAIGILITRTENGEKAFSFKILGNSEFPPVQIGFGFSISAVGLVLAIDCRMDEEKLRAAVYGGTLRSLLFPPDIVANAAQIVRDLNDFFPQQAGTYVVGAMAKLGWGGGEPIVKADVSIFLEFGTNLRVALAGVAYASLPNEQSPILVLRAQVLGVLDFGRKTLAIDASLTGSRVLNWSLDGDLALRAAWGDSPRFALSAGGFFPGYKPPAGFPSLRRLSLSIGTGNPHIGLLGYFAVTENSVQVGAELLFYWEKHCSWPIGHIEIEGTIGFNALFQFNPFYFETDFSATFDLKRNGDSLLSIDLALLLSGPNNYHVVGSARFEICHISFSVDFNERFGSKTPEIQQVVSGKDILLRELQTDKNWHALELDRGSCGAIPRQDQAAEKLYDPLGILCFSQRTVPLGIELRRIGHAILGEKEDWFDVRPVEGQAEEQDEFFAPGDFLDLTDAQKISGPAFEKMRAGIAINQTNAVECDLEAMTSCDLGYETIFIREGEAGGVKKTIPQPLGKFPLGRTNAMDRMEAVIGRKRYTRSPLLLEQIGQVGSYAADEQKVVVVTEAFDGGFELAETGDGKAFPRASYSQVRQAFEKAGGAGTGDHLVDSAKAVRP